jgi:hypothetical protein
MKPLLLGLLMVATACASDGDGTGGGGGGGGGDELDRLPKRGEREGDPTIVSATASCYAGEGTTSALVVKVALSDPKGESNLGDCAATLRSGSRTVVDGYGESGCFLRFEMPCAAGERYVFDITASNETGGVTTAAVSLVAAADTGGE